MRGRVDLNVDIGEGFPHDAELLKFATSANICCGAHAGSLELTRETINLCRKARVRIGLHPGYPDRAAMGRRSMEPEQHRAFLDSVMSQVATFVLIEKGAYLKPHGALYNDTARVLPEGWSEAGERSEYGEGGHYLSREVPGASTLAMVLRMHRLPLLGLPGTSHVEIARRGRVPFFLEGFADRAYTPEGLLVPRSEPGAVLADPDAIRAQVLALAPRVDSICLHGDTPDCLEFAELVVKTLRDAGIEVRA